MGQCQVYVGEQVEFSSGLPVVGRERKYQSIVRRTTKLATYKEAQKNQRNSLRLRTLVSNKCWHFAEEYTMLETCIGSGTSSDVKLARCLSSRDLVAVKTLDKKGLTQRQQGALLREVHIHLRMDHTNIVRLLQVFDEPDAIYLVMEYCSGGTLAERLQEKGQLGEKEARTVIHQVLSAVVYCHGRPSGKVVHRDLKLENFVYDRQGEAAVLKLLDFGLSRVLAPGDTHLNKAVGTLEFMAPEMVRDEKHSEACDLWSVGVMAHTLLCGRLPFDGDDEEQTLRAILLNDLEMNDDKWTRISESASTFVRELLNRSPSQRPSAEAALLKPWMTAASGKSAESLMEVLQCIKDFATENAMRRAAAVVAVCTQVNLEGEDVKVAEKQFQSLDTDGNGIISRKELTDVLQSELGIDPDHSCWVFDQLDLDGAREIHRSGFLAAAMGARLLRSHADIHKVFDCFDLSRAGFIYPKDLTGMLGETFCGKSTKHLFSELDTNGDRAIDFNEFSAMVDTSESNAVWVTV